MWLRRRNKRARLTLREEEALRDAEAYCWGSADVSRDDVWARMEALTPRELGRVNTVMQERVEASRARQRTLEDHIARLGEWLD